MMLLAETEVGLRKNQNQKTDINPDLNLELGTASTVVQIIHIGNVQLMGKLQDMWQKEPFCQKVQV